MVSDQQTEPTVSRRQLSKTLGAGTLLGLAGCLGDEEPDPDDTDPSDTDPGDDEPELGERVPPVVVSYWSNATLTAMKEPVVPILQEQLDELGIEVEARPTEFTTEVHEQIQGEYTRDINFWYYTSEPARADPNPLLERFHGSRAGSTGTMNTANYINCEYSELVDLQRTAPDEDTRWDLVADAQRVISEDAVIIPLVPVLNYGAINLDLAEPNRIGRQGIQQHNVQFYMYTEPLDGDTLVIDTTVVTAETINYPVIDSTPALSMWNHLVQSTLLEYNHEWELENMLAEDYRILEEGTRIEVDLLEDARFQNGDPLLASDVKFTFELLWNHPGSYPQLEVAPWEDFEIINDHSLAINLESPYPPLITQDFPTWGIMHEETWEAAWDNPDTFTPDPFVGSGPFELVDYETGEFLDLEPAGTHPIHDPDHRLVLEVFRDMTSRVESFRAEQHHTALDISPGVANELESEMGDRIEIAIAEGIHPFLLAPNYPTVPSKFFEFRDAIGKAIDRSLINEVAFNNAGYEILDSTMYIRAHPFNLPEGDVYRFTDDPTGDLEAARQVLSDAGWNWDDDGNLHYPPGADLSPLWPDGETPNPDDYACIDSDGSYIPAQW